MPKLRRTLSGMRDDLNSIAITVAGFEQSAENRHQAIHTGQAEVGLISKDEQSNETLTAISDLTLHAFDPHCFSISYSTPQIFDRCPTQCIRYSLERFANVVAAERQARTKPRAGLRTIPRGATTTDSRVRDILITILTVMGASSAEPDRHVSSWPDLAIAKGPRTIDTDVVLTRPLHSRRSCLPPLDPDMDMHKSAVSRGSKKLHSQANDDADDQTHMATPARRGVAGGGTRKTAKAPQRYGGRGRRLHGIQQSKKKSSKKKEEE